MELPYHYWARICMEFGRILCRNNMHLWSRATIAGESLVFTVRYCHRCRTLELRNRSGAWLPMTKCFQGPVAEWEQQQFCDAALKYCVESVQDKSLHDDRCQSRKGGECNCAIAALRMNKQN